MGNTDNRTEKRKLGDLGEGIACQFLKKRGFTIIERNHLRKWGEIDIIATKAGRYHFVEVKSVRGQGGDVPRGTFHEKHGQGIRPEENLHPGKLKRLSRTIEIYIIQRKIRTDWQLDLITVKIDMATRQARVEIFENIVL